MKTLYSQFLRNVCIVLMVTNVLLGKYRVFIAQIILMKMTERLEKF